MDKLDNRSNNAQRVKSVAKCVPWERYPVESGWDWPIRGEVGMLGAESYRLLTWLVFVSLFV